MTKVILVFSLHIIFVVHTFRLLCDNPCHIHDDGTFSPTPVGKTNSELLDRSRGRSVRLFSLNPRRSVGHDQELPREDTALQMET